MPLDSIPETNINQIYTGDLSKVTSLVSYINEWLEDSQNQLHQLSKLPENWDSYGSSRIKPTSVEKTADLLIDLAKFGMPTPSIFPVSGGGIQLEWQKGKRELEIEILPNGEIEFLKVYENGEMQEGRISKQYIWQLVRWFKGDIQRKETITMSF